MLLTKHDVILRISVHFSLIQCRWEDLHVTTATVNLLLVLDCELDDQRLALIAEGLKPCRGGIEVGILTCLQA